jgi:hypothetical protein
MARILVLVGHGHCIEENVIDMPALLERLRHLSMVGRGRERERVCGAEKPAPTM